VNGACNTEIQAYKKQIRNCR